MVFSSAFFILFFLPIVLVAYALCRSLQARNMLLLGSSLVFYAWGESKFFWVMVVSTIINYYFGIKISDAEDSQKKRLWLIVSVSVNLAVLVWFKYSAFFVINLNLLSEPLFGKGLPVPHPYLPAGISFFTFHSLSYLIDVYRGHFHAQRNIFNLGLYISFFPQLISGPIVRYEFIGPGIENRTHSRSDFSYGIERFIIGLAKKLLLANTFAPIADKVFGLPATEMTTLLAWTGSIAYSLQIYFDFSGYSDMAVGLARMFGLHFPENFNYPYIANSITDFWRRWHISLSSWFRDYLYIPLGGNRCSATRNYLNLFVVFVLCGLWHGASWNFLVWGLFHGALLVFEKMGLQQFLKSVPRIIGHIYALLMIVISWVIFRSESLHQAGRIMKAMAGFGQGNGLLIPLESLWMNDVKVYAFIAILAATPIFQLLPSFNKLQAPNDSTASPLYLARLVALGFMLLLSFGVMASNSFNPFIYFRF